MSSANQSDGDDSKSHQSGKEEKKTGQSNTRNVAPSSSSLSEERKGAEMVESRKIRDKKTVYNRKKMAGKAVLGGSLENLAFDEDEDELPATQTSGKVREGKGREGKENEKREKEGKEREGKERERKEREERRKSAIEIRRSGFNSKNLAKRRFNEYDLKESGSGIISRHSKDIGGNARKRSKNIANRSLKLSDTERMENLQYGEQSYF